MACVLLFFVAPQTVMGHKLKPKLVEVGIKITKKALQIDVNSCNIKMIPLRDGCGDCTSLGGVTSITQLFCLALFVLRRVRTITNQT